MLFNPNWIPETKPADVFSLESLIAWLEKQPAQRTYDYCDAGGCLIGQYLKAKGVEKYGLTPGELKAVGWYSIASGWYDGTRASDTRTFGAALDRARAALIGKD